ncbi:MAG: 2-oxoacid:acceptor oxidoreductase family protein, partial [Desulfobacterales bacterium]|nr:2-oxoacid:acceptor oxidoreductase family protein [Desulfobacterales bacterium]
VISDRVIGSPITKTPQHLVAMNLPSLQKFAPAVKPHGVILINSSLIPGESSGRDDVDELYVPATGIAKGLGSVKVANIVALSAFVARSGIVDFELIEKAVRKEFAKKEKFMPMNMEAIRQGREAAVSA